MGQVQSPLVKSMPLFGQLPATRKSVVRPRAAAFKWYGPLPPHHIPTKGPCPYLSSHHAELSRLLRNNGIARAPQDSLGRGRAIPRRYCTMKTLEPFTQGANAIRQILLSRARRSADPCSPPMDREQLRPSHRPSRFSSSLKPLLPLLCARSQCRLLSR